MDFKIKEIDSLNDLIGLEKDWQSLLSKSRHPVPFLDYHWIRIWCKHFIRNNKLKFFIITNPQDELKGIIPLYPGEERQAGIKFKVLKFSANSHSFRTDLIIDSKIREEAVNYWLDSVVSDKQFDYLKFREFPVDEKLLKSLDQKQIHFSLEEQKKPPRLEISGDWESYFDSRRGHFRRNLRRRMRNAEKEFGKIEYRIFDGNSDEMQSVILDGFRLEASGWKGKKGSAVIYSEEAKQFYLEIAENFSKRKMLHVGTLFFGDKMVGFNFSVFYNQTFYLLKVAYDESVSRYSPGQIMTFHLLQYVFENGFKSFDFLGPSMPWKLEWADQFTDQYTLYIYSSTAKAKYLRSIKNHVIPALKKIKFLHDLKKQIGER
ncbi:MAG: GNAT family N-acetyltransferase [Calditrichaeota bacterium]|nr:GNAT family N-acetyltransferase [Calditrichota bacterium]